VQEEIDRLKRGVNRRRAHRARDTNSLFGELLESADEVIGIRESESRVLLMFAAALASARATPATVIRSEWFPQQFRRGLTRIDSIARHLARNSFTTNHRRQTLKPRLADTAPVPRIEFLYATNPDHQWQLRLPGPIGPRTKALGSR
jgi:hypothetical protein